MNLLARHGRSIKQLLQALALALLAGATHGVLAATGFEVSSLVHTEPHDEESKVAADVQLQQSVIVADAMVALKNSSNEVVYDFNKRRTYFARDTNALRTNMLNQGFAASDVEAAVQQIYQRNRQLGLIP